MHARQPQRLAAGFAAGVLLISRLAAQAPAPQITVGGLVYGQFQYDLKDSVGGGGTSTGHQNQFAVKRAYINVNGTFSHGLSARITTDINPTAAGNQFIRLKFAYAAWNPTHSALTYKFGFIHTPWVGWEEDLWDYRMQGAIPVDRLGYMSAVDAGFGIDGRWKSDLVNAQFTIVNGEGYAGGTGDRRKDAQLRVSVRLLKSDDASRVGGLRVSGYAGVGKRTGGGDRNRFIGMMSYKSKQLTLAGEIVSAADTVSPVAADSLNLGGGTGATGTILSAFGVFHFENTPVAAIARVDRIDPNTSTTPNTLTRFTGGLSYQATPNLRLLADLDLLSFQAAPTHATTATRQQALFQMQLTF